MGKKKVGLDIGHGEDTFPNGKGIWKDGKGYEEHHFNSAVGELVRAHLERHDIEVVMAQFPYSKEVPLGERDDIYKDANVDLIVSIHANWNSNPSVNGTCLFYWHSNEKAKELAVTLRDLIKSDGDDLHGNGLHASQYGSWTNLFMTRVFNMPSVLIENGFMGGNKDFHLIFGNKKDVFIKKRARTISKGICEYLGITFKDEQEVDVSTSKKRYWRVQVGSYTDLGLVAAFAQSVEDKTGFNTYVTEVDGEMKVQVGAFTQKSGAEERLAKVKELGYDDAFMTMKSGQAVNLLEPYNDPQDAQSKAESKPEPKKSIDTLVQEVLDGKHGTGDARKKSLGSSYDAVQKKINEMFAKPSAPKKKSIDTVVQEVIEGKWGQGNDRRSRLERAGYNYREVQNKVNAYFGKNTEVKKSVTQVAQEILDGKGNWGNNPERAVKLRKAGYDARQVQNQVNILWRKRKK